MAGIIANIKSKENLSYFFYKTKNLDTQSVMKTVLVLMGGNFQQSFMSTSSQICLISNHSYCKARKFSAACLGAQSSY